MSGVIRPLALVVDEYQGIRLLLEEALTTHGFEVHTADGGKSAKVLLENNKYKVIIIDYLTDHKECNEVFMHIHKLELDTPIWVLTNCGLSSVIEDEVVRKVFIKPFNVLDLCRAAVEEFIKKADK